jgi:outer membrane protein assembly factor BamB
MRVRGITAVGLLVAAVLTGACSSDDEPEAATSTTGSVASSDPSAPGGDGYSLVPPEVEAAAADWPLPGRDHANTRAVPEAALTADNVDEVAEVWRAPLEGVGAIGNAATTPLILGDQVLVQDLASNVRVLDRATGELVWEHRVDRSQIGPNGVAVGWGRAYATKGMDEIMALDLATGDELWTAPITATETTGIDIQPQVAAGLVLVSTVPISMAGQYTPGDRGVLHALDADTGEVVWTFDTVEGDDLWGNPDVNSGGGAWFTPAVDPEAGVVYWGIANPAPFPGTPEYPNGSSRPGPNLYTDSVVALDLITGELLWYEQVFEHDLLDRDHVHTMLVRGDDGPLLVSTGKGGVVLGHDPSTGEVRWRTTVGTHRNDELAELDGPTEVWPGTFGGVITPPAFAEGAVYVATVNAPTMLEPDTTAYIGSELGIAPGEVVAIDVADGSVQWTTEVDGDPLGGATVVGELVFTGTFQGTLYALDRVTGEIVWQQEAPGGLNGWPAATGDLLVWPIGLADPPVLVAFALP